MKCNSIFSCLPISINFLYRSNVKTGSLIISSQVAVQRINDIVTTPVNISFDILVDNFTEPSCVFWEFSVP